MTLKNIFYFIINAIGVVYFIGGVLILSDISSSINLGLTLIFASFFFWFFVMISKKLTLTRFMLLFASLVLMSISMIS